MGQFCTCFKVDDDDEENDVQNNHRIKCEWRDKTNFFHLPPDGREAFIQYTRDQELDERTRQLEFWFAKPHDENLTYFVAEYLKKVCQLPSVLHKERLNIDDIEQILQRISDNPENISSKNNTNKRKIENLLKSTAEIDVWVESIKDNIRPTLNELFKDFKIELSKEISEMERNYPNLRRRGNTPL